MPLFQYKALAANGAMSEGQLEAADRQGAFAQIAGLGLRPVSLAEKAGAGAGTGFVLPASLAALSFRKRSAKVSGRELENFTRLLSSLLAAGVPLSRPITLSAALNPASGAVTSGETGATAAALAGTTEVLRLAPITSRWTRVRAIQSQTSIFGPGCTQLFLYPMAVSWSST